MNETGTTLNFYDVGYPTKHGPCGAFSGTFDIDRNGNLEAFTVTGLAKDDKDLRFVIPYLWNQDLIGDDHFAKVMGDQIREAYADAIKDAMLDMDISACEQDWKRIEAAE